MTDFVFVRQPIGSWDENEAGRVWCGYWFDATGYARRYRIGSPAEAYHTGADLNCNPPGHFDADKLSVVYSIADGELIHVGSYKTWGNIIVARYILEDDSAVYARYAHVDLTVDGKPQVKRGDRVEKGQQIARVGNAGGTMAYHLHFDISLTRQLADHPDDWPKLNLMRLKKDYADPKLWIQSRTKAPMFTPVRVAEVTAKTLFIRADTKDTAAKVGTLHKGDRVTLLNAAPIVNKFHWQQVAYAFPPQWIAIDYTKQVEV